ncbi:MAG: ferredoxin [Acidobacteria bacterium]|nr:MAG: ferredoxin [Acidobacteriota bacterium]
MTYVVVEMCVDCKYTDCAAVCPVEAFHELPDRLYINADTSVPEQHAHWTQINIDEAPKYPVISQKIPALHGEKCSGPAE